MNSIRPLLSRNMVPVVVACALACMVSCGNQTEQTDRSQPSPPSQARPNPPAAPAAKVEQSSAKTRVEKISLALRLYGGDHEEKLPATLEELVPQYIPSEAELIDPDSGQRFVYTGNSRSETQVGADELLVYSPVDHDGRHVVRGDFTPTRYTSEQFAKAARR